MPRGTPPKNYPWVEVAVVAYGTEKVLLKRISDGYEFLRPKRLSFRPIRTPEQIAAEERAKAIEEMRALVQRKEPPFDHWLELSVAGELYDAGYRKFEGEA